MASGPFDESLLRQIRGKPFEKQTLYRIIDTAYVAAIDEIGPSMLFGGRYTPRGEFGALYLTISSECALLERLRHVFGNREALPPLSMGQFQVSLRRHLDLTDRDVLGTLDLTADRLLDPKEYIFTQKISRAARQHGFEGLAVPAATRTDCTNVVVFKDKLFPPSFCILEHDSIKSL